MHFNAYYRKTHNNAFIQGSQAPGAALIELFDLFMSLSMHSPLSRLLKRTGTHTMHANVLPPPARFNFARHLIDHQCRPAAPKRRSLTTKAH
jgi:hypothetical protein